MSTSIAPLPNGGGVTVIAEHRNRRDPDRGRPGEAEHRDDAQDGNDAAARQQRDPHDQPAPIVDASSVPAETLFATALIANRLPQSTISPEELKLRSSHGWLPPDSALRLKDKLI